MAVNALKKGPMPLWDPPSSIKPGRTEEVWLGGVKPGSARCTNVGIKDGEKRMLGNLSIRRRGRRKEKNEQGTIDLRSAIAGGSKGFPSLRWNHPIKRENVKASLLY